MTKNNPSFVMLFLSKMAASTKEDVLICFFNNNFDSVKSLDRLSSLRDDYKRKVETLEEKVRFGLFFEGNLVSTLC